MFIPGALHGVEASFLAVTSLRKLRAAFFGGLRGLVGSLLPVLVLFLACLMVIQVVILFFCVVWCPGEVSRVYRLLERVAEGGPGHGPVHLLLQSVAVIGFRWDPEELAWDSLGLPLLSNFVWSYSAFSCCYPWCLVE